MHVLAAMDVMHEGQLLPNADHVHRSGGYSPTMALTPESLLLQADQALYEAKAQGRNRVVVASGESSSGLPASEARAGLLRRGRTETR